MSNEMMDAVAQLDGRTFFHGTSANSAICISEEGFRILDDCVRLWGGHLGTGIYVTRNPKEALLFGSMQSLEYDYLLEVEFTPGTRIARLDDKPDRKLLDSLRREFGHEILTTQFAKAIPKNKHLKPRELFALIGRLEELGVLHSVGAKRNIRKWLYRLNYHGYGHTRNDLGVVLFDPSRLRLLHTRRVRYANNDFTGDIDFLPNFTFTLRPAESIELLCDAEAELVEMDNRIREIEEDPDRKSDADKHRTELEHRCIVVDNHRRKQVNSLTQTKNCGKTKG